MAPRHLTACTCAYAFLVGLCDGFHWHAASAAAFAETVQVLELGLQRQQAQTDAEGQRKAAETFLRLVEPWSFNGMSGNVPLQCGDQKLTGEVKGIGYGAHGVSVSMHRGSPTGEKVVVKLWNGEKSEENLSNECKILRYLEMQGLQHVLRCLGQCEENGHIMIMVAPFVEGTKQSFLADLKGSFFKSDDALLQATRDTLSTGFDMLKFGVANIDQGHNILYQKDGKTVFIDMGMATKLSEEDKHMRSWHAAKFIAAILKKIPKAWWESGVAISLIEEVGLPKAPAKLKLDYEKLISEAVATYSATFTTTGSSLCGPYYFVFVVYLARFLLPLIAAKL